MLFSILFLYGDQPIQGYFSRIMMQKNKAIQLLPIYFVIEMMFGICARRTWANVRRYCSGTVAVAA
ncbi:MAG: hypothetical protein J5725_10950 [Bacteroidales bacterium]|nr:hypothetical protein [Bacteroidales bacterium]